MKHVRKKWMAAALALVMALTLLPANALAAFGQTRETGTRHEAGSAQELKEALASAQAGDVIALTGDITVTNEGAGLPRGEAVVTVPAGVTLDGGGHRIVAAESWNKGENSIVGATSGHAVIRDLTVVGNENTKHGVNIYSDPAVEGEARTSAALENVTIENCGNAGLVVANSVVTADGLITRGNAWGAVNVDRGTPSFTMTNGKLEENIQIWTEAPEAAEIQAEGLSLAVKGMGDGTLKGYTYFTDDVSKLGEAYDEENKTVYTALEEAVKVPEVRGLRLVRSVTVGSGQSLTIPATLTLTIAEGAVLTVEDGGDLTNSGEIVVEDGGELSGTVTGGDGAVKHLYTVRFDANGGEAIADQTVENGQEIELPQAVREDHDFLGWTLEDETYAAGETYTVTASVTFTAQWEETAGDEDEDGKPGDDEDTDEDNKPGDDEDTGDDEDSEPGEDEDTGDGEETWKNPYADVAEGQWFYASVRYVTENGLMTGVAENAFGPDIHTTRGMLVTILHRLEGEPEAGAHGFTDVVEGKYYAEAVAWAAANDIVNGYSDTEFAPERTLSREEMAAILYRYAQYKGHDVSVKGDLDRFADSESVGGWALEAMTWAVGAKILDGMDGRLAPQGDALRSQTATVLMRMSALAGN